MTRRSLLLAGIIVFSTQATLAQRVTGDLQLRVADSLGQALSGVHVLVTGANVQGVRGGVSDDLGYCRVLGLPPGKVVAKISHAAYQHVSFEEVPIQLGKTTTLGEIRLRSRTYELPELIVSGSALLIDPSPTSYGANLRAADVEALPVERNYRHRVSLLPQANGSYYGDGVNIAGATGFENKYFVDGVEVTDPLIGATATSLPYNFVEEIELKAGGYDAESRSALGGLVNAITYSGTNEFHGSVFGFYTNNWFAGNRKLGSLDPTQGDFSDYDIGFGVGGPIVRDELWFYAAYNPTFARRDVDVPGFGISVDRALRHSFAAKLTWRASEPLRVLLTVTGDPTVGKAVGRDVLVAPSGLTNPDPYLQDIKEGGVNVSLNGTYSITQNILLEASLARVMKHDTGDPSTERGRNEAYFVDNSSNIWSGGPSSWWDSFRYNSMARIKGTLLADAHTVEAGIEYRVKGVDNRYGYNSIYRYDSAFYEQYVGRGFQTVQHRLPSVFVQDTWQIVPGLRVHAGIRWDGQYIVGSNGEVVQKVTVPIQPRLGFAYVPDEAGTQKIFGSFGRYSQELALFLSVNNHSDQGYDYTIDYDHDPRVSWAGADTVYGNLQRFTPEVPGLRGQFFDEYSLGYERVIGGILRVSVQGVYRTLREAIDDAWVPAENEYRFGNPGRGLLSEWPRPQRDYTALILTIERRQDEHFNFLASYVLSRDYGNYEGLFDASVHTGFPNQNSTFDDLNSARQNTTGLVPNDRTHVFKFAGSYRFSFGLSAGISLTAQSGTPLSEYAYQNIGVKFLSPRGTGGRTPATWDLNARAMYELPFEDSWHTRLILDVFHIASQRQPVDIDQHRYYIDANGAHYPIPTYGQAYRYQPPMSVRLGMEVRF